MPAMPKLYLNYVRHQVALDMADTRTFNPLSTTGRYTVGHIGRFLTVLKYSPIGVKFSPATTLRTLYTVKKKNSKIFKTFFVLKG
jgi:hypothetical protein